MYAHIYRHGDENTGLDGSIPQPGKNVFVNTRANKLKGDQAQVLIDFMGDKHQVVHMTPPHTSLPCLLMSLSTCQVGISESILVPRDGYKGVMAHLKDIEPQVRVFERESGCAFSSST